MTYAMTYLGAALMAYNIYRYIRFSRDAGVREDLKQMLDTLKSVLGR